MTDTAESRALLARLVDAQNAHDIDAFVDCFAADYRSEQPIHPDRAFVGADQVRRNWTAVFAGIPDFRAEIVRSSVDGDAIWSEWDGAGTSDGEPFHQRGVIILGVRDARIGWARLYLEDVEEAGETIDEQVRRMTGRDA